jgi:hypothetical protein
MTVARTRTRIATATGDEPPGGGTSSGSGSGGIPVPKCGDKSGEQPRETPEPPKPPEPSRYGDKSRGRGKKKQKKRKPRKKNGRGFYRSPSPDYGQPMKECPGWARGNRCYFGDRCWFLHDGVRSGLRGRNPGMWEGRMLSSSDSSGMSSSESSQSSTDKSQIPCRFFLAGHCKKGTRCDMLHDANAVAALSSESSDKSDESEDVKWPGNRNRNKNNRVPGTVALLLAAAAVSSCLPVGETVSVDHPVLQGPGGTQDSGGWGAQFKELAHGSASAAP